jgi:hypothetical protein
MVPMNETTFSSLQYRSFLVRLWRESDKEGEWIAQVEHIVSGKTKYFSSLDEMFAYLRVCYTQDDAGSEEYE